MLELEEVIPQRTPMLFDVMLGDRFYRTVALSLTRGMKYHISELKEFAKLTLPSLRNKDFSLLPTVDPVYRN